MTFSLEDYINENRIDLSDFEHDLVRLDELMRRTTHGEISHLQFLKESGLDFEHDLKEADFDGVDFSIPDNASPELKNCLTEANFYGANLRQSIFNSLNLTKTNFEGAVLTEASFERAILEGANFKGAVLVGVNFTNANLSGSNFEGAILEEANLRGAILTGAIMRYATLIGVTFQDSDLTDVDINRAYLTLDDLRYFRRDNLPRASEGVWILGDDGSWEEHDYGSFCEKVSELEPKKIYVADSLGSNLRGEDTLPGTDVITVSSGHTDPELTQGASQLCNEQ